MKWVGFEPTLFTAKGPVLQTGEHTNCSTTSKFEKTFSRWMNSELNRAGRRRVVYSHLPSPTGLFIHDCVVVCVVCLNERYRRSFLPRRTVMTFHPSQLLRKIGATRLRLTDRYSQRRFATAYTAFSVRLERTLFCFNFSVW